MRPAGAPAEPDFPSFASAKERTTEAHKQFQAIVDQYPHTRTAEFARYFLGLTSYQLGDNAAAERDLKAVASTHNEDLAALAKLALAAVYRDTNRTKDAIDLYNQLIAKPTRSVGKTTAQMELADMYASTQQPGEAKRVYEQIQKENPASEVAQFATQKLQAAEVADFRRRDVSDSLGLSYSTFSLGSGEQLLPFLRRGWVGQGGFQIHGYVLFAAHSD